MLKKKAKKKVDTAKAETRIHRQIASQTLTLIVSSLGLVAALAWNEAIKEYVNVYIKPYFEKGSGVVSLFLYALGITIITVITTIQLNRISAKVTPQD